MMFTIIIYAKTVYDMLFLHFCGCNSEVEYAFMM